MTVTLQRPYAGYPAQQVCTFDKPTEDALVTQGQASTSSAAPTAGAVTLFGVTRGRCGIAAGVSSVVITTDQCLQQSTVVAVISQSAADATLTSIVRVTPAAGSFTITGNANATAITQVDWVIFNTPSLTR